MPMKGKKSSRCCDHAAADVPRLTSNFFRGGGLNLHRATTATFSIFGSVWVRHALLCSVSQRRPNAGWGNSWADNFRNHSKSLLFGPGRQVLMHSMWKNMHENTLCYHS